MYRKKLMRACLMGTLVVSMAASNVAPYAPLAATTVQAAGNTKVNVVFVDENGNNVGGGDQWVDEDSDGIFNYSELELPEGYELNGGGETFTGEASYTISVKKTATKVNVVFIDENGDNVGGGDQWVDKDGDGIFNYSELELPEGYELNGGGETFTGEASYTISVKKVQTATKVNVVFIDENGNNVGGGDQWVDKDGDGIFNYSELELPEGYELNGGGETFTGEASYTVSVKKTEVEAVLTVTFETTDNEVVGKVTPEPKKAPAGELVDYVLAEDFDLPEGYKLAEGVDQITTIQIPAGSTGGHTMIVEKVTTGTMINVTFVDAAGNSHGGGDVIVDTDGDGIFKLDELNEIVPEGYKLTLSGDQFVSDYEGKSTALTVEKIQKGTIINVVFEDRQDNNLGGGDYLVDEDGDGVANYSELDLPAGYKLIETGDFFVKDAADGMTVVLDRDGSAIIHVVFKSEGGKNLGGGDYFVDEDGDGVFNYSELDLPVGYELIVTGDEFVDTDKTYEITLHKINAGTIINVVFVDEEGNNLGGGDYFVDMDDDGIANFSELDVPEGYKLVVTGDFFVADYTGQTNEIKVEKIQKGTIINVVFEDRQGNNLGGGDYLVDEDGDGVANYSELDLPAGYKLIETGDFFVKDAADGMTVVLDRDGSAIIHVVFKSEGGKNLGGGDYFVDEDGDGVFNYSELDLPVGYELIVTGDEFVDTDKTYEITLHKINAGTIINVVFVDEEGNNLGGGDYFVDMDDDGIANFSELDVPEGYKLVVTGDFFVADYTGQTNEIKVEKIQKGTIINVVFEDRQGNNLGGGDYLVDEDGDGVANYSELDLPAGYKLIETGDFFVKDAADGMTVVLDRDGSAIIHVVFKSEGGKNLGGGDYFVDEDGDGVFNYSELDLPVGYELIVTGDEFVDTDKTYEITLHKINAGTIINVVFVDEEGNNLGGGDYFVDMDDDGIANFSELDVPEGYKLVVTGDFFVADYTGQTNEIKVEKIQKGTIINVVFEDRQGNNLGGGDYLVDEDGDGVANYSELDLPAGYKLIETGDFFVKDAADGMTVVLDRDGSAIIHVVFKSEGGKNLGGGDYFVDEDGDGVFNYSELDLPVGYELIVTGDEFVDTDKTYEITLHKINAGTIIDVVFVDEEGNNLGGGDYFVDMDDDGIANFSELTLPEGYELIVTGDFFVDEYVGHSNTIVLKKIEVIRDASLRVTFETTDGKKVWATKMMTKEGVEGEDVVFSLGEDFHLPLFFKLAEGVDQITDITIPAGSVGGHTMIVEPIFDVRLPKLQLHLKQ